MKTKTLIIYLNSLDKMLEKILGENPEEVRINLYKFNVYMDLLNILLTHWKNINASYSYDEISVSVSNNMLHILNETEDHLKNNHLTNLYKNTNRKYWELIRRDLKMHP